MNIVLKKTADLTEFEKSSICKLFLKTFDKPMTIELFDKKFLKNELRNSYHSLLVNEDEKIVGCYSSIPQLYEYFGSNVVFGLSVDTMIDSSYRGNPYTLKKLANKLYAFMKSDGVSFVFGFPNDNIYLVRKKLLKWKDIGKLDFYVLPIRIGTIVPSLKLFEYVSRLYAYLVNIFPGRAKLEKYVFHIVKNRDPAFITYRYDDTYKKSEIDSSSYFVYKNFNENGIVTAYIIDVYPLTKANFNIAVRNIYLSENDAVDLVVYVGSLPFSSYKAVRVPSKYHPKIVHMSGKILDNKIVDERVFEISNWNVNLSNYDVR